MAERRLEVSASTSERDIVDIGGHDVMPSPRADVKHTLVRLHQGR